MESPRLTLIQKSRTRIALRSPISSSKSSAKGDDEQKS